MGFWSDKLAGQQPAKSGLIPPPYQPYVQYQPAPPAPVIPQEQHYGDDSIVVTPPSGGGGRCPSCHSNDFFTPNASTPGGRRIMSDGSVRTLEPRCGACGYPRVQFGSDMGLGSSVKGARGEGQAAPQPASLNTEAHLRTWDPAQGGAGKIS